MQPIRRKDWLKTYFRSFYIQVGWNYERMIALGFIWILLPLAQRLFPEKDKLKDFVFRHLKTFNANPYLASYAIGAVANLETHNAPPHTIDRFKEVLRGPLGSLGDNLIWFHLRPALTVLGIVIASLYGLWGVIAFWVIYNLHQVFVRARGIYKGYILGTGLIPELSGKYFPYLTRFFSILGAVLLGAFILLKLRDGFSEEKIYVIIFLGSAIFSFFLVRKRVNPAIVFTVLLLILMGVKLIIE